MLWTQYWHTTPGRDGVTLQHSRLGNMSAAVDQPWYLALNGDVRHTCCMAVLALARQGLLL
jgi:hypothetical protein